MEFQNGKTSLGISQIVSLILATIFLGILLFSTKGKIGPKTELSSLSERSLSPELALTNSRPSIFEFYADWCEVCQEMAPDLIKLEAETENKINLVLLNVDNQRWIDLIEKYGVQGVPQLTFFNSEGMLLGSSVGFHSIDELKKISNSLIAKEPLQLTSKKNLKQTSLSASRDLFNIKSPGPTSHS